MQNRENLSAFTKEELIRLIEIYSKNWLAMDGVWFQSVERKLGMEEAMYHDAEAWRRFTVIILLGKPFAIAMYSLGLTVLPVWPTWCS